VADEALAIWSSDAPDENHEKFALQLPKQDFYAFKLCTVHYVRLTPAPETPTGFWSRPVEVGTNIEVDALLVSGRRSFLAEIRHCFSWD